MIYSIHTTTDDSTSTEEYTMTSDLVNLETTTDTTMGNVTAQCWVDKINKFEVMVFSLSITLYLSLSISISISISLSFTISIYHAHSSSLSLSPYLYLSLSLYLHIMITLSPLLSHSFYSLSETNSIIFSHILHRNYY